MRHSRLLFGLLLAGLLSGCSSGELTNEDIAAQRKQFSKENYEKTMREQGRGAELDEAKRDEAERKAAEQGR